MRISRSAIATRRSCQVKRYFAYDYAGTGLERTTASLPLAGGLSLHAALARIGMGANVDQVIADVCAAYAEEVGGRGVNGTLPEHLAFLIHEQQTLIEGLIRGWVHFRLPLILEEYEPVSIEQEWLVDMGDGFELPLRIDWLERHRGTGLLHIRDFKGQGYLRDGWREHYLHDLQTLLYPEAVERHTGEYVGGIEYEALLKGARKKGGEKSPWPDRELQQSPLCYGYAIEGKGAVEYQAAYTARKGARKFAVWEEFADVEDWLTLHLDEPTWRELYAVTGMISPTKAERARALTAVKRGEEGYATHLQWIKDDLAAGVPLEETLGLWLEPDTSVCYQFGTRHACEFHAVCPFAGGASGIEEEPVESGRFRLRADHHAGEMEPEREAA